MRLTDHSLVEYYRQKAKMLGNKAVSPDGRFVALIEDAQTAGEPDNNPKVQISLEDLVTRKKTILMPGWAAYI